MNKKVQKKQKEVETVPVQKKVQTAEGRKRQLLRQQKLEKK